VSVRNQPAPRAGLWGGAKGLPEGGGDGASGAAQEGVRAARDGWGSQAPDNMATEVTEKQTVSI